MSKKSDDAEAKYAADEDAKHDAAARADALGTEEVKAGKHGKHGNADKVQPFLDSLPNQNEKVIQAIGALVQYAPVGSRSRVDAQNLLAELKVSGGILNNILTGEEGEGHVPAPRTDVPDPQIPELSDEADEPIADPWNPGLPVGSVPVLANAEGENVAVTPDQVAAGALDGLPPGADPGLTPAADLKAQEEAQESAKDPKPGKPE